ncbi:hypothetical protein SJR95_15190 [Aeromonas caviae]|uniref:P-loop ATPase, Sll1717 family n=1 Tax=Aeromonas caviae TaxID=648 RepID=UPI0029DD3601|nr:hypothetical protein [Aeromonas caviae]MDX7861362.1 hypothetical protein [Aeromonas caviae]
MVINKNWKSILELKEPFNDAINYSSKDQKQFFSKVFLRTIDLERCLLPTSYYLIGEKGSGKTAYAVYLENNSVGNNQCKLTTMTETQYKRFIAMKQDGRLTYSDYANIWRSMLLLLVAQMIVQHSKGMFDLITKRFSKIEKAIEKWNLNALNPEIESAFELLSTQNAELSAGVNDVAKVKVVAKEQTTDKTQKIKHHLLETEHELKEAIKNLKLGKNQTIFIDGLDYRPEGVPYNEYIECVKGLSEATWQLNTEFFNSIKDSKGRIKITLLIRPDVFHKLNLYNSNSRLQDNSVFLNWTTTEKDFRGSDLLGVSGRYFSTQQTFPITPYEAWSNYHGGERHGDETFKSLLRYTFQKPRDILTYIRIARRYHSDKAEFPKKPFSDANITREFSDYLLGEVKNYASFYMKQSDFGVYLKFFQYLNGKSIFSMQDFIQAFDKFKGWASGETIYAKEYLHDSESLLQFFYDVNIIGYREKMLDDGDSFYHWAYRERTINNISPKIKGAADLILNPGISKALDIGKVAEEVKSQGGSPATRKRRNRRRHNKYKPASSMSKN